MLNVDLTVTERNIATMDWEKKRDGAVVCSSPPPTTSIIDFKFIIIHDIIFGTVSAKIAPRLKCYKNASRLNRYNFPTDNAIDFLFSTLHTTLFHYEVLKIGSR